MSYFKLVVNDFKVVDGCKCFRIQATRNFENAYRNVKKGELGGYVYNTDVLQDNSWVFGNAVLMYDVRLSGNSYIVGNGAFNKISGQNIQIISEENMNGHVRMSYANNIKVDGYFKGSFHPVVFGKATTNSNDSKIKVGDVVIYVGCNLGTIEQWKRKYAKVAKDYGYAEKLKTEYKGYLDQIVKFYSKSVDTNETKLVKISQNVEALKKTVTEPLKTETVTLIESLQVSSKEVSKVVSKGPQRDKFGRFVKKTP